MSFTKILACFRSTWAKEKAMSLAKTLVCIASITATVFAWTLFITHENSVAKWQAATKDDVAIIVGEMRLNGSASKTGICFMSWVVDNHYYLIEITASHATISVYYPDPKHELTAQDIWRIWLDSPENALPWIRKETFQNNYLRGVATHGALTRKTNGGAFYAREIPLGAKADIIIEETNQRFWHTEASDAMQARYRDALRKIAEHIRRARHPGK